MKTLHSNLGLGDARSRNRRIKKVNQRSWRASREEFFRRNCRFAAAAKAYRVLMEVTQGEVGRAFGRAQGTVCNWESGKYSWPGGQAELEQYVDVIKEIAKS